jgi:hypothetical protein
MKNVSRLNNGIWFGALLIVLSGCTSGFLGLKKPAQNSFSTSATGVNYLPVVPGAYGYGMETRAAYACGTLPTILRVTNLNDSGAGSFRAAVEASGPRVVIFEVSGYIEMASIIWINSPCLTVAG